MIDLDNIRQQVAEYQRCVREGEDAGFAFRDDPVDLVIALLAEVDRWLTREVNKQEARPV